MMKKAGVLLIISLMIVGLSSGVLGIDLGYLGNWQSEFEINTLNLYQLNAPLCKGEGVIGAGISESAHCDLGERMFVRPYETHYRCDCKYHECLREVLGICVEYGDWKYRNDGPVYRSPIEDNCFDWGDIPSDDFIANLVGAADNDIHSPLHIAGGNAYAFSDFLDADGHGDGKTDCADPDCDGKYKTLQQRETTEVSCDSDADCITISFANNYVNNDPGTKGFCSIGRCTRPKVVAECDYGSNYQNKMFWKEFDESKGLTADYNNDGKVNKDDVTEMVAELNNKRVVDASTGETEDNFRGKVNVRIANDYGLKHKLNYYLWELFRDYNWGLITDLPEMGVSGLVLSPTATDSVNPVTTIQPTMSG